MMFKLIRKSLIIYCLVLSAASSHAQSSSKASTPDTPLPAPSLWLRSDLSKLSPTVWSDRSGNRRHAIALPGEGPQKGEMLNFNPALTFDGLNDYMKIPYNAEGLSALTLMAVFKSADTTERGVWGTEKALTRNMMLSTRRVGGPDSVVDLYGHHENRAVISTIVQQWIKSRHKSEDAYFAIGSMGKERSGKPFKGLMAEMIIFDAALPFMERQQFETYLAIKYGITLLTGNYVSSQRRVLWDREKNKAFAHRITAIGRDDAFELYQKQSQSVHDSTNFLLLSAGSIATSNQENITVINNQDFLLLADNNMLLASKGTVENKNSKSDTTLSLLERKWMVNVSGVSAAKLPTTLGINIAMLEKDSLGYWLVIDRSGEGNFSVDNLVYMSPDSVSADKKIAYFRKLRWDTDGSSKDIFTFARAKAMFVPITSLIHPTCNKPSSGSISSKVLGGKAPFIYELSCKETGLYRKRKDGPNFLQGELEAGDYLLRITDASNRIMERSFSLKAPISLHVDLGEDRKVTHGQMIELNAASYISDSTHATYQWESSYGFQSNEPKVNITESGIYRVKVTTPNGCEFGDEVIISGSIAQRFEVMPNIIRTGDPYKVSISLTEAAPVSVKVYDMKGKVYEQKTGQKAAEHHIGSTIKEPGMYMILLETSKGIEARKLIVH